jgi:hypothetical protein
VFFSKRRLRQRSRQKTLFFLFLTRLRQRSLHKKCIVAPISVQDVILFFNISRSIMPENGMILVYMGAIMLLLCYSLPKVLDTKGPCGNHNVQLLIVHLLVVAGFFFLPKKDLVADHFRAVMFLRTGGHFIRLLLVVDIFVETEFKHIEQLRDPQAEKDVAEYLSYLEEAYKYSHPEFSEKSLAHYMNGWRRFFQIVNGRIGDGLNTYSIGAVDQLACKSELKQLIKRLVLNEMPSAPSSGKWGKFEKCMDWFGKAQTHHILKDLSKYAFQDLRIKLLDKSSKYNLAITDKDPTSMLETSWHQVFGSAHLYSWQCFCKDELIN